MARGGMNHAGEAVVNGMPEPNTYALAMGTHAIVSGGRVIQDLFTRDPRRLFVIGDVVATVFLWVFRRGGPRGADCPGPKPRFWRGFVWSAAQRSRSSRGFAPIAYRPAPGAIGHTARLTNGGALGRPIALRAPRGCG